MGGFLIKRTNITAGRDITYIGMRGVCGMDAAPYRTRKAAEAAIKRQEKQDFTYCPECLIIYEPVEQEKAKGA